MIPTPFIGMNLRATIKTNSMHNINVYLKFFLIIFFPTVNIVYIFQVSPQAGRVFRHHIAVWAENLPRFATFVSHMTR